MKKITIDFLYLDLNTCERCRATGATLDEALVIMKPVFQALGYDTTVNKVNIISAALAEKYQFISSPTIRVNGVDISSELQESDCKDCGDLCGDSVDCRVFVYDGKRYEQPPAAMIIDGTLRVLYGQKRENKQAYALPDNLKKFIKGRELTMKTMKIFEPAMCCPTGLCGVGVDPELLRISTILNTLEKKGAPVERFNLTSAPMEFVTTQVISEQLMKDAESLPITTVDGAIVLTGRYPSNDEFITLLDLPAGTLTGDLEAPDEVKEETEEAQGECSCEGGCC